MRTACRNRQCRGQGNREWGRSRRIRSARACFSPCPGRVNYCAKCGSPLVEGAQFCPQCGASVGTATPSQPVRGNRWWIVPSVLVGVVALAWLLLARMPFGTSDEPPARPQVDTVAEAPAPAPSATIVEVPPDAIETRNETQKGKPRAQTRLEISPSDAEAILRHYVTASDYYRVKGECLRINNRGYRNVGYTLEIWNACEPDGASRMLGSWRVDAKTREVFRRRDDGRYLRP